MPTTVVATDAMTATTEDTKEGTTTGARWEATAKAIMMATVVVEVQDTTMSRELNTERNGRERRWALIGGKTWDMKHSRSRSSNNNSNHNTNNNTSSKNEESWRVWLSREMRRHRPLISDSVRGLIGLLGCDRVCGFVVGKSN